MRDGDFLHNSVAGKIAHLIETGTLRPGDRVMSVRRAARAHGVSLTTAVRAYGDLEESGLIESRPKSGFYVRPRSQQSSSSEMAATRSKPDALKPREVFDVIVESTARPHIVPLGAACPGPDLLPGAKLSRFLARAGREQTAQSIFYTAPPGFEPLRRQIAQRAAYAGCSLSAGELIVTSGCMDAICLSLSVITRPGDTVAVESPSFYGILNLLPGLDLKVCEIQSDPVDGMDLDALERAIRRKKIRAVICVANFSNPLGSRMSDENKQRLVGIITRHGIPLVDNDVYGDLAHFGSRPRAVKSYDREGLVLWCGSYSKSLVPGYRVGWVSAAGWHDRIKRFQVCSSICPASPTQIALASFLAEGGYENHLRLITRMYAEQVAMVSQAVAACFPSNIRIGSPAGGFLLWIELPEGFDAMRLYREALAENISIAPGPLFSTSGQYGNCIRLSCGFPWSKKMERAIGLLGRLVKKQLR